MSNKKVKVPSDLTELFKEALINNTYDIESVERSLVKGLENSFAFLYRVQRNKVPFTFFKFKTKERNILYNLNEIEEMIKNYREQLSSIDLNTRPDMSDEYNMIQKKLTELTTVDFGDYYTFIEITDISEDEMNEFQEELNMKQYESKENNDQWQSDRCNDWQTNLWRSRCKDLLWWSI